MRNALVEVTKFSTSRQFRLVGRDREFKRCNALLNDGQALSINGLAGIGKTRLAAEIAEARGLTLCGSDEIDRALTALQNRELKGVAVIDAAPASVQSLLKERDTQELVITRTVASGNGFSECSLGPLNRSASGQLDRICAKARDRLVDPRVFPRTRGVPRLIVDPGETIPWLRGLSTASRKIAWALANNEGRLSAASNPWLADWTAAIAELVDANLAFHEADLLRGNCTELWLATIEPALGIELVEELARVGGVVHPRLVATAARSLIRDGLLGQADALVNAFPNPAHFYLGPVATTLLSNVELPNCAFDWCSLPTGHAVDDSMRVRFRLRKLLDPLESRPKISASDLAAAALEATFCALFADLDLDMLRQTIERSRAALQTDTCDPLSIPEIAFAELCQAGLSGEVPLINALAARVSRIPANHELASRFATALLALSRNDEMSASELLCDLAIELDARGEPAFAAIARRFHVGLPGSDAAILLRRDAVGHGQAIILDWLDGNGDELRFRAFRNDRWSNVSMTTVQAEIERCDLSVDLTRDLIYVNKGAQKSQGRPTACALLAKLVEECGAPVSPEALYRSLRGGDYHPLNHRNSLYVTINRVRRLLKQLAGSSIRIETTSSGWRIEGVRHSLIVADSR